MALEDKFTINLNQNLWGSVVTYAALGIAEHWKLHVLFCLSCLASLAMTISVLFTVSFYTWNYCRRKIQG